MARLRAFGLHGRDHVPPVDGRRPPARPARGVRLVKPDNDSRHAYRPILGGLTMPRHAHLTMAGTLAVLEAAADTGTDADRALVGLALPYGAPGRTSAGTVTARAGAVRWPVDLKRIKVFAGHDRRRP